MNKANEFKEKGNHAFQKHNFIEAADWYSKAIHLHQDSAFYSNRAACYIHLKRFDQAIEDCLKAISLDDKLPKPYYRLSQAYCSNGQLEKAFEALGQGTTKIPEEVNMRREYDNIQILIGYRDSIDKLTEEGDFNEALKKATSVLEKCEMDFDVLLKKIDLLCRTSNMSAASTLVHQRESFMSAKCPNKLAQAKSKIARYNNKLDDAKRLLGNKWSDNESVLHDYRLLQQMETTKQHATDAFKAKKFNEAHGLYAKCLQLDPFNKLWKSVIYSNQASCLMGLNKTKEARDAMKLSTDCDPNNAKNWYKRGRLEKDLKEWEAAESCMTKAKSLDSTLQIDSELKQVSQEVAKANEKDYYAVLGLKKDATAEQIKKAYKEMVRKHHPDKHAGSKEEMEKAERRFKEINEANEVLSDPQKKQMYDLGGHKKGNQGGSGGPNFGNYEGFSGGQGFPGAEGNVFQMFFGNGSQNSFNFDHNMGGGHKKRHSQGFPGGIPKEFQSFFKFG